MRLRGTRPLHAEFGAWSPGWVSLLLVVVLLLPRGARAGMLLVDVLDIGQGDAILLRAGGKTVLIDAADRGKPVVDQLLRLGVTRLDLVIATHPHADHIGSMKSVVERFDIGLYVDNGLPHTTETYADLMAAIETKAIPYKPATAGTTLRMGDDVVLTVLFPTGTPLTGTRSDLNSNSVVVLADHGDVEVLLVGDAEAPTEQALVAGGIGDIDVLKVAHHGSGHSSTSAFLAATRPEVALISVGEGNRYGHPDPEALDRLTAAGAAVYRTDVSGHLRLLSDGRTYDVFEGTLDELGATWPLPALGAPLPVPPAAAAPDEPEPGPSRKKVKNKVKKLKKVRGDEGSPAAGSMPEAA